MAGPDSSCKKKWDNEGCEDDARGRRPARLNSKLPEKDLVAEIWGKAALNN